MTSIVPWKKSQPRDAIGVVRAEAVGAWPISVNNCSGSVSSSAVVSSRLHRWPNFDEVVCKLPSAHPGKEECCGT